MGVYAYCVVPPGHPVPPQQVGLDGAVVEELRTGEIALWVSRGPRPTPGVEAVRAHNAVVEAAVTEQVTPVPLRFGQWLENDEALLAALKENAAAYADRLEEFKGCLEFGLRLLDPEEPQGARVVQEAPSTSGLEYMRALQENSRLADSRRSRSDQIHARIRELLDGLVRAELVEATRTPHAVLTLSHLVARKDFAEYRDRARAIRDVFPELRMLLSGPWPPYSFAV